MMQTARTRIAMPVQSADRRRKNFSEVALGYTKEQAVAEARRCLACKNKPCVAGCPVGIDIPSFVAKISEEDFDGAYQILRASTQLPAVCGRVCSQETQCEARCVRGIRGEAVAIGSLERFIADDHAQKGGNFPADRNSGGRRIAVIGSGPAGLSCAGVLCDQGYDVTVFEALHEPGGVLTYGIPEFRLPKKIVAREIELLARHGVKIRTNEVVGKTILVEELFANGYEAVFIGSGAGLPRFLDVPGENLKGVYSANEYLTRINLMKANEEGSSTPVYRGKRTLVFGGGNVAMDAARCARRMGSEVTVVYRRSEKDLPARAEEVLHASEEGIEFLCLANPVRFYGDDNGYVAGAILQEMMEGPKDADGRSKPIPLYDSEFSLDADMVIVAIGTMPNPILTSATQGLATDRRGVIRAEEESGKTSLDGVFAGGDAVTGAATVILAMGAGKRAAVAIDQYMRDKEKEV